MKLAMKQSVVAYRCGVLHKLNALFTIKAWTSFYSYRESFVSGSGKLCICAGIGGFMRTDAMFGAALVIKQSASNSPSVCHDDNAKTTRQ